VTTPTNQWLTVNAQTWCLTLVGVNVALLMTIT
jgi:hypothetical protein